MDRALFEKIRRAQVLLEQERPEPASKVVLAFVRQMEGLVRSELVGEAEAEPVILRVRGIVSRIDQPELPFAGSWLRSGSHAQQVEGALPELGGPADLIEGDEPLVRYRGRRSRPGPARRTGRAEAAGLKRVR